MLSICARHLATERLIEASGLRHALLRNAWYHEVYTRLVGDMVDSGELVASTGDGRVSGAARADFAAAAAAVLVDGEAGVYELGGDDFTLAVEPVPTGSQYAVGAEFDSAAAELTDWYRRTDEDGNPVAYDYSTGEYLDEDDRPR